MGKDELYDDEWLEFYDKMFGERNYRKMFYIVRKLIHKHTPDAKDMLELACGTGRFTKYYKRNGFNIRATDFAHAAVRKAQSRVHGVHFGVEDMSKLKYKAEFDLVTCHFESFRYNKNHAMAQRTINGISRALKQGGIFICDFFVPDPTQLLTGSREAKLHKVVNMSGRRKIIWDETIRLKGKLNTREDHVQVFKKRFGRKAKLLSEQTIERHPLLIVTEHEMKTMCEKAGMKMVEVIHGTALGGPRTRIFIAKK